MAVDLTLAARPDSANKHVDQTSREGTDVYILGESRV